MTMEEQDHMEKAISGLSDTSGRRLGVSLRRGSEAVMGAEDDGLIWPEVAKREFDSAKQTMIKKLRSEVKLLARARGTKIATDVEVRDVIRQIVVGGRQTVLIRVCRIATVFAVLAGGAVFSKGWDTADPFLAATGVGLAIVLTAFQELLLHYKR